MTRTDDIINVAAHRLSTGEIEEVVAAHPDVAECAVMGVADPLKGQVPLGLVVLKAGAARPEEIVADEVVALVRERIGPVASFKTALVVDRPAEDALGQDPARHDAPHRRRRRLPLPATIDDPAILGEIEEALGGRGIRNENPRNSGDVAVSTCRRGRAGAVAACSVARARAVRLPQLSTGSLSS